MPQERFVLKCVDMHTRSAAEFVDLFHVPCACVGPGDEPAPDWWLVLSLTHAFEGQQSIVIAGTLIFRCDQCNFCLLFVFVTDGVAETTASDNRLFVVDARSLDAFASPVTSVIRHATSKKPRTV